jgi:hypothetical protein
MPTTLCDQRNQLGNNEENKKIHSLSYLAEKANIEAHSIKPCGLTRGKNLYPSLFYLLLSLSQYCSIDAKSVTETLCALQDSLNPYITCRWLIALYKGVILAAGV